MRATKARRRAAEPPDAAAQTPGALNLGWLGQTVGFNLRIAHEASVRAYLKSVSDLSTLPGQFAILALIDDNPGLTQVALGRAIMRESSSLTPVLDDLCNRRLVSRVRPPHDRRSYALRLTARGKEVMEQLKASVEAHEKELDRLVTAGQRTSFVDTLKRIAAGLTPEG